MRYDTVTTPQPNRPAVPLPARRRLRSFAFDPMSTRLSGRFLTLDIPFEPNLQPGPAGDLVVVVDYDPVRKLWYEPLNLNDPAVLAQDGLRPVENDPRAHQQVVYAVTMSVHALEGEGCPQEVVARILMRKREWNHRTALVGGQLKDGVWVFVMVPTGTVIE